MSSDKTGTPRTAAVAAAEAADSKKATDITVQEVGPLIGVTDYFVIATARNKAQADAVLDAIEETLRERCGMKPIHREVSDDGSWSLLDYGSVVAHIFLPEAREHYRLEALWDDAAMIDLAREAGLAGLEYSDRIRALMEHASRP